MGEIYKSPSQPNNPLEEKQPQKEDNHISTFSLIVPNLITTATISAELFNIYQEKRGLQSY